MIGQLTVGRCALSGNLLFQAALSLDCLPSVLNAPGAAKELSARLFINSVQTPYIIRLEFRSSVGSSTRVVARQWREITDFVRYQMLRAGAPVVNHSNYNRGSGSSRRLENAGNSRDCCVFAEFRCVARAGCPQPASRFH